MTIDGCERSIDGKTTIDLPAGAVVSVRTPGGGGYGDPSDRDPSRIDRDLREERITEAYVLEHYSCFLEPSGSKTSEESASLREITKR